MEIRSLDPADIGRSLAIRTRAFGPLPESSRPAWEAGVQEAIDKGLVLGAYDEKLLVARALVYDFRQYWGGQVLPMAGVAGVIVAPEYRARGVGSALMRGLVTHCRALGYPVSCLYPATVPVYRQQGWEVAGAQTRYSIRTRLLRELRGGGVSVREATAADAGQMAAIMRAEHAAGRVCGARDHTATDLAEDLADDAVFGYLADDGFVVYGWQDKDVVVHQLVAASVETARALWAIVGSSSSVAEEVHAYLAPDDALHQLLSEPVFERSNQTRWMLRLLDVRQAISARGYAAGVEVDVPVVINDAQEAANCLSGRLRVAAGRGELVESAVPQGIDAMRLGANGVAALYAGAPTSVLATAGLLSGGSPEDRALLDAAFAGRPAYMLGYF
ncbi:MAG: GNAT family N-acetyltransferase [Nocardioidaceae bacterium]